SAFEALQYFRLLAFDETACDCFESNPLRPVAVRKRLEALGHDAGPIRQAYGNLNEMSHVGGSGSLAFDPHNPNGSIIAIGGFEDAETQTGILHDIVAMTHFYQAFAFGIPEERAMEYFDGVREA